MSDFDTRYFTRVAASRGSGRNPFDRDQATPVVSKLDLSSANLSVSRPLTASAPSLHTSARASARLSRIFAETGDSSARSTTASPRSETERTIYKHVRQISASRGPGVYLPNDTFTSLRAPVATFSGQEREKAMRHHSLGPGPSYYPQLDMSARHNRAPRCAIGKTSRLPFYTLSNDSITARTTSATHLGRSTGAGAAAVLNPPARQVARELQPELLLH